MAEEFDVLCPTCHSRIGNEFTIGKARGELGTDADGLPVPKWTDDPILTINGFSGPDFKGQDRRRAVQITEIQDERKQQEEEAGFTEEQKTVFSDITAGNAHILALQINELRESTEKLLNANSLTLEEYFKLDANGEEATEPGPNDTFKNEWTDVERGRPYVHNDGTETGTFTLPDSTEQTSPAFPANTRTRAIHVEDLRRTLLAAWREFWSVSPSGIFLTIPQTPESFSSTVEQVDFVVEGEPSDFVVTPTVTTTGTTTETYIRPFSKDLTSPGLSDFPTVGFDLRPTDGGMRFDIYNDEKTWRIDAHSTLDSPKAAPARTRPSLLSSVINRTVKDEYLSAIGGQPIIEFRTATASVKTTANGTVSLESSTEPDALALNSNAQTLVITTEANGFQGSASSQAHDNGDGTTRVTIAGVLSTGLASLSMQHAWLGFPGPTSPIGQDQSITINSNTRFRGIINVVEASQSITEQGVTTVGTNAEEDDFLASTDIRVILTLSIPSIPGFFKTVSLRFNLSEGPEFPSPFFTDASITEDTISDFFTRRIDWDRKFGERKYEIDINIDKALIKLAAEVPSFAFYIPQTEPNPTEVIFRDLRIDSLVFVRARASTILFQGGTLPSFSFGKAKSIVKIDALRINKAPILEIIP